MLLIGFVLFAYLKVPLVGIALFGLAIAIMYVRFAPRRRPPRFPALPGGPGMTPASPTAWQARQNVLTEGADQPAKLDARRDLRRSFWRYFWTFEISWNYERMQALGFAYAMEPVLRRLFPEKATTRRALSGTWCSSTPTPSSARR